MKLLSGIAELVLAQTPPGPMPYTATQLKHVILVPQFWFAWSQFHQGTRVFNAR